MATGEISAPRVATEPSASPIVADVAATDYLRSAVEAIASLRLTVTLFALSVLLILFGTLAQVHYDIWHVVRESHFYVWWAWVEWRAVARFLEMVIGDVFPESLDANQAGVYFPGGKLIGTLMMANLLAAHGIRFRATAKGAKLLGGWLVIALGVAAVTAIVLLGNTDTVKTELSPAFGAGVWRIMHVGVTACALAGCYWSVTAFGRTRRPEWLVTTGFVSLFVAAAVWLNVYPDVQLDDAGLKILWHLIKGTAAAVVLLAGCLMVFGSKRGGMVLIHGGIGLLMLGEALVGFTRDEAQMVITEGQTANYAFDSRETELAFVDRSDPAEARVTVVPQSLLEGAATGEVIRHPELPVDLKVLRFDGNSVLVPVGVTGEPNQATAGAGLTVASKRLPPASGIEEDAIDLPSAYVELLDKESARSLGVYLTSASNNRQFGGLREQPVSVGEAAYGMELRFKRLYKDYQVALKDFQVEYYPGTTMAKDYRAEVRLTDASQRVDRDIAIWMNNPLRYAGDTLYQSGVIDERTTSLQVVTNSSWLIPYLSCQIVLVGMLAHFGISLNTFARRRVEEARREAKRNAVAGDNVAASPTGIEWKSPLVLAPVVAAVLCGGYLASKARPAKDAPGVMRINEFGALPLAEGGRIKPYDTYARNTLQHLSGRQTVLIDKQEQSELAQRVGATKIEPIRWLLDVIARKPDSFDYRVFRIENLDLLDLLDLERRPGSYRYSYDEVTANENDTEIARQVDLIRGKGDSDLTLFQTKIAELSGKLNAYRGMATAFAPLPNSGDPERAADDLFRAVRGALLVSEGRTPRPVAPAEAGGEWLALYEAELNQQMLALPGLREGVRQAFGNQGPNVGAALDKLYRRFDEAGDGATAATLGAALAAYAKDDTDGFNSQTRKLKKQLAMHELEIKDPDNAAAVADLIAVERMSLAKSGFEAFFTRFSPFYYCMIAYLAAFFLCVASWVAAPRSLGRAAVAIIAVTFLFHTFALLGRVYISGRAPVTNLYSSAVFIGWGIVLIGLCVEGIFKMGIGSVLASVFGVATLRIAGLLGVDGDTFAVLVAVLDTNFWLWTHVLCVAMGYVATFAAGGVGIYYLLSCHMLPPPSDKFEKTLARLIYGTVCFGLFFSFVGTVLGGLWGDNSWGRFWGWDPKENGALIIVLWNALILHARWGKMVSGTGLAVLAVIGNLWTTWSWFGVNEMGVGLHAYGGLSDGVSTELTIMRWVFATHPVFLAIAAVPRDSWRRLFGHQPAPTEAALTHA
ncbi:MAG: cytochrome c biogenesis protein CcsA [Planctomycetota bacterium]